MRIAFASLTPTDFNANTPLIAPLGGAESAACHLAAALARLGHQVTILSNTSHPGLHHGVQSIHWNLDLPALRTIPLDVLIVLRVAGRLAELRAALPAPTKLVLWAADDHTQSSVRPLKQKSEQDALDGLAAVSHWQREKYILNLGVPRELIHVIRNPLAAPFEDLFAVNEPILTAKSWPPVLAYTSAPYRGLELLLDLLPEIQAKIPGTRLKVFSSMKVYQMPAAEEEAQFGPLYRRCAQTPGVEYLGSLPQPELAQQMKSVSALAYTNIFMETSCMTAIEAMAAGCRVVTSDLGALPETTAGYADLISPEQHVDIYKRQFVDALVRVLHETHTNTNDSAEAFLQRQARYALSAHATDLQARNWTHWLEKLPPSRPPTP